MDKELSEIKTQVITLQQSSNQLSIENQMEMDLASDLLLNVSKSEKFVISKKEEITRPIMASLAKIRDLFKPIELNLADAKKTIKAKMLAYQLEEEERINKEKEKIAKRVEKGTMRADTAIDKLEAVGDAPKSNMRTLKKIRIVDETIIPREYLIPDLVAIKEAVLNKGILVAGVETYEEKSIIAR